ncbi:hypothetical protein PI95_031375 [Hassallia byssoidea VB512170]|uniref:Uncharacterized protein n=1 Tax=Hassallia byssoidea VB512170 TaxID=1304833 RepID=A0A846HKA2_9CYAN|nr:hypothetical protein [Hassalia byssoidea]NEU76880.1 hypothetical protein [Hassalia byssoidea VB512170]
MNNYFNTFENITQSVEQLLKDEHNSLEIKQSATSLKNSVKPCIEEVKQSATKLKQLIFVCSDDLYRAENIWLSKPMIASAAKHEIWEQLGEISGRSIKISQLGSQCKNEAVTQAKQYWDKQIDNLRNNWFIDAKGQQKIGVVWDDKKGFSTAIKFQVDNLLDERIAIIIKGKLILVYQEVLNMNLKLCQYYVNMLDQQKKTELNKQINLITIKVENKFNNPIELLPKYHLGLKTSISPNLKALVEQGWGGICWDDVVKFKDNVSATIENFITAIFDDRIKLATEAMEKAIAFYNDFLEQQERYQQETPEYREAEKAWIYQQRQELMRVQDGIEVILNAG